MIEAKQVEWDTESSRFKRAKDPRINILVPAHSRVARSRKLVYRRKLGLPKNQAESWEAMTHQHSPALEKRLAWTIRVIDDLAETSRTKCGGVPVLKGTTLPVSQVIDALAQGKSVASIAKIASLDKTRITEFLRTLAVFLDAPFARNAGHVRIVQTPGICGGEPRVRGTRIPVWTLEVARRDGCSDGDILSMYPVLKKADLIAASEWVRLHHAQIESAIRENED